MSESNEGDAATQTAVGTANITGDQLTSILTQREAEKATPVVEEAEPEVEETTEEVAEVQEEVADENVEGEVQAEPETPEEASEEVADESENVLSKNDKAIEKMQKSIDRKHYENEALKERLESLETQMRAKYEASENSDKKLIDVVSEAKTFDDLNDYETEAREAKKFALQNVGKDEVEYKGNVYGDEQIRQILLNAEEVLESIPKKRETLHHQQENEKLAMETWADYSNPESSLATWYNEVLADKETSKVLDQLPNKRFVMGLIYEGQVALAERAQASEKPKVEKKVVKKETPAPTSVPGMNASAPPAKKSSSSNLSEHRKKLTSTNHSSDDLAQFLDSQYKQKS